MHSRGVTHSVALVDWAMARLKDENAARCRHAPGSSARSAIPMWRAPSATVFAPARPISSPKSTTNIMCSSTARASSISARRRAAGARSRRGASARKGRVIALDILDMKPIPGVEFLKLDFLDDAGAGAAQSVARRQSRRRALRHGGERDRPSQDRSLAHHGACRSGGRTSRARCSPRAARFSAKCCKAAPKRRCLSSSSAISKASSTSSRRQAAADSAELYLLGARVSRPEP